jgi:hypothetical protein
LNTFQRLPTLLLPKCFRPHSLEFANVNEKLAKTDLLAVRPPSLAVRREFITLLGGVATA